MVWLANAKKIASPNFDLRPANEKVRLLVIHNISLPPNTYSGDYVEQFFCNKLNANEHPYFKTIENAKVSAHLYIRRTGELIQFVGLDNRAWHAGQSEWQGHSNCNDFSIGIELEGSDVEPFTPEQYESLNKATKDICAVYPAITEDSITGHSDIAAGRKTDPGPHFDWEKYKQGLIQKLA